MQISVEPFPAVHHRVSTANNCQKRYASDLRGTGDNSRLEIANRYRTGVRRRNAWCVEGFAWTVISHGCRAEPITSAGWNCRDSQEEADVRAR